MKLISSFYLYIQYQLREIRQTLFAGNGEIDFNEFLDMMAKRHHSVNPEEELKEAFKVCLKRPVFLKENTTKRIPVYVFWILFQELPLI